jgi:hypothetical protein
MMKGIRLALDLLRSLKLLFKHYKAFWFRIRGVRWTQYLCRVLIVIIAILTLFSSNNQQAMAEPAKRAKQFEPLCGPMDVVFLIDDTGSMGPAIQNVKAEAAGLIADISAVSGGDFQLGLVTFKDQVVILQDLAAGNAAAVEQGILTLIASAGGGEPEASDEALNTVINGLDQTDRLPGQQIGNFDGVWRPNSLKIIILITDALPGGFDDRYTSGLDDINAHNRALEAAATNILISAVYVPSMGSNSIIETIMQDYATTTGGAYIKTISNGIGTAAAIADIIRGCGTVGNLPPLVAPIADQMLNEGVTLNVAVSAADPDGDPIILSASGLPPFVSFSDNDDGTGTLILTPGFEDEGVYPGVRITASDGHLTDSKTFNIVVNDVDPDGWNDICAPQRMEITGVGMGNRHNTINPQTLMLTDSATVNWLLAQVAGRSFTSGNMTFATDAPQLITLNEPKLDTFHNYRFETNLQPTSQVTASLSNPGDSYKTPRGLILYAKRATASAWTSIGRTTIGFVWADGGYFTHTEVLTFPALTEATDLFITAAVIDNDDDERILVLEATAGGVTENISELGPTHGKGLNIINLTLLEVPTGTSQVSVTLHSPSENGDSMVLVGLNVSHLCSPSTAEVWRIFLPVIFK